MALAAAALALVLAAPLSACDQARDDFEEAVTGKDKIAAGSGAVLGAELGVVAAEVAGWYTVSQEDPKVQVSGGVYYVCGATEADCAAAGLMVSPASDGVTMTLARLGADSWCLQAADGANQAHIAAGGAGVEDGPC
jgi:hypothetical protein